MSLSSALFHPLNSPKTLRSASGMRPYRLDSRIRENVEAAYPCPRICMVRSSIPFGCLPFAKRQQEWVRKKAQDFIEEEGHDGSIDYDRLDTYIDRAIKSTSFRDIAVPGTGLPPRINHPKVHETLDHVVLEIVHLTELGINALELDRVRQSREWATYLNVTLPTPTGSPVDGQSLSDDQDWPHGPAMEAYPRRRLKLSLSDGFIELQAIELDRLDEIELGETSMGTKVRIPFGILLSSC